jgi:hypothetical protein
VVASSNDGAAVGSEGAAGGAAGGSLVTGGSGALGWSNDGAEGVSSERRDSGAFSGFSVMASGYGKPASSAGSRPNQYPPDLR